MAIDLTDYIALKDKLNSDIAETDTLLQTAQAALTLAQSAYEAVFAQKVGLQTALNLMNKIAPEE